MKFYDSKLIKEKANCAKVAEELLGAEVLNGRCRAVWRGGTNPNVQLDKDRWYDHKTKDGGSVIDLIIIAKGMNVNEACDFLGRYLGLEATNEIKQATQSKILCEYVYKDMKGNPVHKTIRFEPKDFIQKRWNGAEWLNGLKDIELVPYNLPDWTTHDTVYINEGEKACEACMSLDLPATTFALGAENWKPYYTPYFENKDIVIIADNDDAGQAHARRITWELRKVIRSSKVITVSEKNKGDCADFVADGGTKEELVKIANGAKPVNLKRLEEPSGVKYEKEIDIAKIANQKPFTNAVKVFHEDDQGNRKAKFAPINISKLIKEIHKRLLNFPKKVGEKLFDHDRDTGNIRYINNSIELLAWISEKTGHNVIQNRTCAGVTTMEQLYSSLEHHAPRFESICGVPNYPLRNDVFYTHDDLPEPTEDAHFFNKLISMFNPATHADHTLIKCAFVSPIFYIEMCDKPLFIIDTKTGQGSGKSKLVDMIAQLYGDPLNPATTAPIDVLPESINNEQNIERVYKRLLSTNARQKRIVRLDNITGYFKSDPLASLITQPYISGMPAYAKGEETRPNDLQFFITSNNASVSADLVSRGFFIHVEKPTQPMKDWERMVVEFIRSHRLQIFADIIGMLERGVDFEADSQSRFRVWEKMILLPVCENLSNYSEVWKTTKERRGNANGEQEEAETIRDHIIFKLTNAGFDYKKDVVFIESEALVNMTQQVRMSYGGRSAQGVIYNLKLLHQSGMMPELSDKIKKFPHHGTRRKRGLLWDFSNQYDEAKKKKTRLNIKVAKLQGDEIQEHYNV